MNGLMLERGSHPVTMDALRTLPSPQVLGNRHMPVRHDDFVDAIVMEVGNRNWNIESLNMGIANGGKELFGVMDLRGPEGFGADMRSLYGFRNSINQKFSRQAVAGARVMVCSNLCFSGDMFVMRRKNTINAILSEGIAEGMDKFMGQTALLQRDVERLKNFELTDGRAKEAIFDIFNDGVLPHRLLPEVGQLYFSDDRPEDCEPRTMWGVNNACTRSIKKLPSDNSQFAHAVDIGKHFQLAMN